MVELDTIIALPSIIYIADLNTYECHQGIKKSLTTSLMNTRILHSTCHRNSMLFISVFV